MRFHSKYSESASRFSCLQLPGAPVKNILLPIKIKIDGVNVDKSRGVRRRIFEIGHKLKTDIVKLKLTSVSLDL